MWFRQIFAQLAVSLLPKHRLCKAFFGYAFPADTNVSG
jgi:hypothetical protein